MNNERLKMQNIEKYILILGVVLSVLAAVIKIFVGFDIDEGYAISMPFRLLEGDHLFKEMWEVHQTSSFLPALIMLPFYKITGATEGIAVYMRIMATLVHTLITFWIYKRITKSFDIQKTQAVMICLIYYNMLPKWMMNFDFSMQQIWGMTLVLICLLQEKETVKLRFDFLMGLSLAWLVLTYPGMLICYPALLLIIVKLNKDKEVKIRLNKCLALTGACALCVVLFLIYVLSKVSLSDFLGSIPMIFMDGTHQFSWQMKFALYGKQWLNVCKQIIVFLIPAVILTMLQNLYFYKFNKTKKQSKESTKHPKVDNQAINPIAENKIIQVILWATICTSLLMISGNFVGLKIGPFFFQVRYLLFVIGICIWIMNIHKASKSAKNENELQEEHIFSKTDRYLLWGPMFLNLAAFVGILLSSNVGPDSSSSYLVFAVMAGFGLLLSQNNKEVSNSNLIVKKEDEGQNLQLFTKLALYLFVLSLIFCKGFYVRITEYGPSNLFDKRIQITEGPQKGIYLLEEDYKRVSLDQETVESVTKGQSRFLFLGTEGILNLSSRCPFTSVSTISTPAFNDQWVEYYEMYPDLTASVIVIAKNTVDDRQKFFEMNPFGKWIDLHYDTVNMEETDSLCIVYHK